MNFLYISLYYDSTWVTGANKRFDEIGRRLFTKYGDHFLCIATSGNRPHWCPEKNCHEVYGYHSKPGRLRTWLELSCYLFRQKQSRVLCDFMPIPIYFCRKKHIHLQLIHDLRSFGDYSRGGLGRLTAKFQSAQLQSADKVITVSEFSAQELVSLCNIDPS